MLRVLKVVQVSGWAFVADGQAVAEGLLGVGILLLAE